MAVTTFAQVEKNVHSATIELFPSELNFLPLRGYAAEAKLGILYYTANSNLKVDIGNTMEIIKINTGGTDENIKVGIEFMGYAYSTSYKGYRLQISALDGFFGGHVSYKKKHTRYDTDIRFRYMHNSAHLVDGSYELDLEKWKEDKLPIPFTRDFAEIFYAPVFYTEQVTLRPYAGLSWAARIRPGNLKRTMYMAGVECYSGKQIGVLYNSPLFLFGSYYTQLAGLPEYMLSHNLQAGIKFGKWNEKGLNLYLCYYKGNNFYNEYHNQRISRFGVGFTVDFPG
ncbi:MAG: hypothetical protein HYV28_15010 [Ignavibacteriales bacterium]|nr:hypothetical protein [Ignavibacteriales bacterium]